MVDFICSINFSFNEGIKDTLKKNVLQNINNLRSEYIKSKFIHLSFTYNHYRENVYKDEKFIIILNGYAFGKDGALSSQFNKINAKNVAELYLAHEKDFIEFIKGNFSILVVDLRKSNVIVFTDEFNIYPLFYYNAHEEIIISTTPVAIVNYLKIKKKPFETNYSAILQYIYFNLILNYETFVKNIFEIPPCTILTISKNNFHEYKRCNLLGEYSKLNTIYTHKEGIEVLDYYLKKNISLYNDGPESTAVSLTGGYDSRLILAYLNPNSTNYDYFSYGNETSWDIQIPEKIAKNNKLNYQKILLEDDFAKKFDEFANLAIFLGDGTTSFTQANNLYAYVNFPFNKKSFISGLFGSELIKYPSTRGSFLDNNIYRLLFTENIEKELRIISNNHKLSIFNHEPKLIYEILAEVISNQPLFTNNIKFSKKLFLFVYLYGAPNYFRRELMLSKHFIRNYFPLFDTEFTKHLIKTPFTWGNNFTIKKSFINNLKLHSFYSSLIKKKNNNLNYYLTAHGFSPILLTSKFGYPFILLQYSLYRKRIKQNTILYNRNLITEFLSRNCLEPSNNITKNYSREHIKLNSIKLWLKTHLN